MKRSSFKSLIIRFAGITVLFLCAANFAIGQNAELSEVVKRFNTYTRDNLHEKIFIHTDKETYLGNEVIWVKAYSLNEVMHTPMALSRIVYLELLNVSNESFLQTKVELVNGKGNGSVDISNLPTGIYRMRAYTRWMMNFDESYFFEKSITIINAQSVPEDKKATERLTVKASFYPEGGHLVEGLASTVGFKITDNFGTGLEATGTILDQNNSIVASFKPLTFGLGQFKLTPQKGTQYKAVITYRGETIEYKLPEVQAGGYVMEVKDSDKLSITVTRSNVATESEYALLLAHTRQQVKSVLVSFFKDNKAVFTIDKSKLGDGISHITIFDKSKNPICERLVFKHPVNRLEIDSKPQTYQFATREQVNVSIYAHDSKAAPVAANLSFSMYALDSLQSLPQQMGILSYMYLVSDLGDRIEQPDYYFAKRDSATTAATDNLMLTYGWRKFDWKQVVSGTAPALTYAPEYEGQILTGIARDESSGMLADSARVFLSVAGKRPVFRAVKTDRKGNFEISIPELYGINPVIFQASGYNVQLNEKFDSRRNDLLWRDFIPAKSTENTLTVSNIHTQVVRAFETPSRPPVIVADTSRFYGRPTVAYNLDDYVRFPTLEDVFREYVPSVIIRRSNKKAQLYVVNNATQSFFEQEPLILLDGVPVVDTDVLLNTEATSIKRVAIVNQKYYMGRVVYNGIMDISTYKGNLGPFDIDPKAIVIDYDGLQRMRSFQSPEYSTPDRKSDRLPDFRNVLYWQPDVETDATGNQVVTFYTSDKKGNFVGVIHGMTKDGLMGSRTFTITVK